MRSAISRLIAGDIPYVLAGLDQLPPHPILLSGSFNPLHRGHAHLLAAAEKVSQRKGLLELSVTNVDKPPLELEEVEHRLAGLQSRYGVVLTRAPTFAEKAVLLPDAWFAMGFDTVVRLLDPKYHANVAGMLEMFAGQGTRVVVAGRLHDGEYQSLEQLDIPAGFEDLFTGIPEQIFREDISSTELRERYGT